jgi:hypothetical protein
MVFIMTETAALGPFSLLRLCPLHFGRARAHTRDPF